MLKTSLVKSEVCKLRQAFCDRDDRRSLLFAPITNVPRLAGFAFHFFCKRRAQHTKNAGAKRDTGVADAGNLVAIAFLSSGGRVSSPHNHARNWPILKQITLQQTCVEPGLGLGDEKIKEMMVLTSLIAPSTRLVFREFVILCAGDLNDIGAVPS